MPNSLVDTFGRVHRDLRVSLTDRCSLRCTYCLPNDYSTWLPSSDLLTTSELLKVIQIGIDNGIEEVRLTGGEPLLRSDVVDVVAQISTLPKPPKISLTTNGIALADVAEGLANAGLERINISLDTLQADRFEKLTHRNRFHDVMEGLLAAKKSKMRPIKINTVLMRGINDDEAADLLAWSIKEGFHLRFIEQMPLDAGHRWDRSNFVTSTEILQKLSKRFSLAEVAHRGSAPAQEYYVDGTDYRVGIIASITQPFCGNCDRLRLTSDGQLRSCLFSKEESDLRSVLRNPELSDEEIREEITRRFSKTVISKARGHGVNDADFVQPNRPMSAIGG